MAKTLELQFVTSLGSKTKLTIDNPIEPINPAVVKLAMEKIVQSKVFFSPNGELVAVSGARLVERNVSEYDMI